MTLMSIQQRIEAQEKNIGAFLGWSLTSTAGPNKDKTLSPMAPLKGEDKANKSGIPILLPSTPRTFAISQSRSHSGSADEMG